jgi:hypothetical protein
MEKVEALEFLLFYARSLSITMATVQLNHTVAQIMPSPTATALLIEANQTSPWTPSTISAIIIGSATVALGIPGAIAAFYAFRKHRRRNGRHQSTGKATIWFVKSSAKYSRCFNRSRTCCRFPT